MNNRQLPQVNTIHLRDFVDDVQNDSSRTSPNHMEIHSDINVFSEAGFSSTNITTEPIHICIRAYLTQEERALYTTNAFFYADGTFYTTLKADGTLEITVHSLSLMRYINPAL